ncbi:hypothetical protein [Ruficoccus sp. ZRK36]|uniref:hypothetical protein n=1 Tax=Ruficoccus sp. ZRK36 TaxID=2866311 RepID=UPI001C73E023|nr:hypothetical protein [Ruficoccus sp. ZRK36]QYY36859.1 hypothetical protein K0V07_05120 [Ruficoccus sp. ZRK36]
MDNKKNMGPVQMDLQLFAPPREQEHLRAQRQHSDEQEKVLNFFSEQRKILLEQERERMRRLLADEDLEEM